MSRLLTLCAILALPGCVSPIKLPKRTGIASLLSWLPGGGEEGSIFDAINMTVMMPAMGLWMLMVIVGTVAMVMTPMGPKLLIAGGVGFVATLLLILVVSFFAQYAWLLLLGMLAMVAWFLFVNRNRLRFSHLRRVLGSASASEDTCEEAVKQFETSTGLLVMNGGDRIRAGLACSRKVK